MAPDYSTMSDDELTALAPQEYTPKDRWTKVTPDSLFELDTGRGQAASMHQGRLWYQPGHSGIGRC